MKRTLYSRIANFVIEYSWARILVWLGLLLAMLVTGVQPGQGQRYTVLHTFGAPGDGQSPYGGLILGSDGYLYGTTTGGPGSSATIFRIDSAGNETILYTFEDGSSPVGPLLRDDEGNLYGTSVSGGLYNFGTIFKFDTAGVLTDLYEFTGGADGGSPIGGLLRDSGGNFYGVAQGGGLNDCTSFGFQSCGVVFKLDMNGQETVLHNFNGTDGLQPWGGLISDGAGNLYGTTAFGGGMPDKYGVLFKLNIVTGSIRVYDATNVGPGWLLNSLLWGGNGDIYGTAGYGSFKYFGSVFKIDSHGKISVLHAFSGGRDGSLPFGNLVRDAAGNFYGVTSEGGNHGRCGPGYSCGVAYRLDPISGALTTLHMFADGITGAPPVAPLAVDNDGNVYGVTQYGGDSNCGYMGYGCGVVFKIVPK